MDCERVFQVLTSGPFPSGADTDVAVEQHLESCIECWRFAEALRPAHDLFQESMPPIECRTLPGYWGDAPPPGVVIQQAVAGSLRIGGGTGVREKVTRRAVKQPLPVLPQPRRSATPSRRRTIACVVGLLAIITGVAFVTSWPF